MLCMRCLRAAASRRQLPTVRRFSAFHALRSSDPTPSSPVGELGEAPGPQQAQQPGVRRSICPEGTILTGLNFMKGGLDPVAMKDEDYPEWLWSCLDVKEKKSSGVADDAAADEFSKSKKQRRLAGKQQKAREVKLMASGDQDALAPKVPLQHQSINLPGEEGGSLEDNIAAADKRDELKRAMRKERKAKIKESNYLKSM